MAKTKAQAAQRTRPAARPRARAHDPDRLNRLLLVGGIVAIIIVALGFIGFGWYQTQIKPLGKTILVVGDTKFTLGHLERRMQQLRTQSGGYFEGQNLLQLPDSTVSQLAREGKLLWGAGQLNITVTEAGLSEQIRLGGGLSDAATSEEFA